jgi:hypothetical protein
VSNQELIDCCDSCQGTSQDWSFNYTRDHLEGRVATFATYPYHGPRETCKANATNVTLAPAVVGGNGRAYDDSNKTGDPMLSALLSYGPSSLGIDANCLAGYSGGIISNCSTSAIDHEVLMVGAGSDNGISYFTFKNSWGSKWGESGYFRATRAGGQLGIGSIVFPLGP